MSNEVDLAGAASAGSFLRWRRHHALPPGALCRNCATPLRGPWCYACGQLGEDFHRSAHHLVLEAFESFFHADGRVFRTLPRLVINPGRLTHDYLMGKRAPQIPPLRLFLVTLLIVFLVGTFFPGHPNFGSDMVFKAGAAGETLSADQQAKAREEAKAAIARGLQGPAPLIDWLHSRLPRAIDHPQALIAAMGDWAERFAFMTLPVSAALLWLIFLRRPGVYLFDHLVFSMHSLSFQGLLIALVLLTARMTSDASMLLLWAAPVHLFAHMRGVYGTGVLGTLVRMAMLFCTAAVAFALLMLGLVLVGLNALAA